MERKMGSAREDKLRYDESVTVRISDELRIKADGVVLFPHEFVGNTVTLHPFRSGSKTANTPISIIGIPKDWAETLFVGHRTSGYLQRA